MYQEWILSMFQRMKKDNPHWGYILYVCCMCQSFGRCISTWHALFLSTVKKFLHFEKLLDYDGGWIFLLSFVNTSPVRGSEARPSLWSCLCQAQPAPTASDEHLETRDLASSISVSSAMFCSLTTFNQKIFGLGLKEKYAIGIYIPGVYFQSCIFVVFVLTFNALGWPPLGRKNPADKGMWQNHMWCVHLLLSSDSIHAAPVPASPRMFLFTSSLAAYPLSLPTTRVGLVSCSLWHLTQCHQQLGLKHFF